MSLAKKTSLDGNAIRSHFNRLLSQNATKELVLMGRLTAATTIESVLDAILYIFEAHGIANVRFYSAERIGKKKVLVSVDCAGHKEEFRREFAFGGVVHRVKCESESTLCFDYSTSKNPVSL